MTTLKHAAASLALAGAVLASPAGAEDSVESLRAELDALRADYAARLGALEARIAELGTASAAPAPGPAEIAAPEPAAAGASPSLFNPAISLILGGHYADTSEDPETWRIAGFMPSGGEVGPGEQSFNLGESELILSANVDPYFSATLTAAITGEDEIEVEEAFVQTLALPAGFTARAGRFFSGFGYVNEQHAHAWDFVDQPLVYQALFGNQRGQDGLQVKWLAPADLFIELGAETGNGDSFPGTRESGDGLNGMTLFAHLGGDFGDSTSWRLGASWIDIDAADRRFDDGGLSAFAGDSETWGVDAVLKWQPVGSTRRQQLKLQGEYFERKESGELVFDVEASELSDSFRSRQSGWYVQGVYQFLPRWRAGLRYDALDSGTPRIGLVESGTLPPEAFPALLPASPERTSLMLDWNPSEFSRLRVQYAWDEARDDGERDGQLFLQYLHGIGAHGAHKY